MGCLGGEVIIDYHNEEWSLLGIASRPATFVTNTLLFTGEEVWRTDLPSGATGAPMSCMLGEYIFVAIRWRPGRQP